MKTTVLRFKPGQDLKQNLINFCKDQKLSAGFILSGIGSLKKLNLRLANSKETISKSEAFEILSLQGSLSEVGVHVHMIVADQKGQCWGGHLLEGCEILTTAEILIAELPDKKFTREMDSETGYLELKIT